MADLELSCTFFEKAGRENTERALEIARKFARQLEVKDIIIASTSGECARKALAVFSPSEYNLVVIGHSYYFVNSALRQEFPEEQAAELRRQGVRVFFGTHATTGIERNVRTAMNQWCFVDLMAKYIREQFSQGTKVCMEIAAMAADAGLIESTERDIICLGGTGHGADTVCLIKPAPTGEYNRLRVRAILAKPL